MSLPIRAAARNLSRNLRFASSAFQRKRFYKEQMPSGLWQVTLDGRPLPTQAGKKMELPSAGLAAAVAQEWARQDKVLKIAQMHLTGLAFTATDNPLRQTKSEMVRKCVDYLLTDTILVQNGDTPELLKKQRQQWTPVVEWVNAHLGVDLKPTEGLILDVPETSQARVAEFLDREHDEWTLVAIQYAVEACKSLLLVLSALGRHIDVDELVTRATLEQAHQIEQWGEVEWAHPFDREEMRVRVAAALLFVDWTKGAAGKKIRQDNEDAEKRTAAKA